MPQPLHVRAINRIVLQYRLLTATRSGLLAICFAVLVFFQFLGSQTSSANAGIVGDLVGVVSSPVGALFGGVGSLAGSIGGKALKSALEWLFGGLESTITLSAMRSVTRIISLPTLDGRNNSVVAAVYIMAIPIFAVGTMLSVSQAMYGSMGSSEPMGGYGRVILRSVVLVVAAAAWYPIVQLLVVVTNDLSGYFLSDEVMGGTLQKSFAQAHTDKLAPILMLLVYLILAVSWLLLVVAKGVLTLSFVMIAVGGPVILGLSTFPPARNLVNWLTTTVATLVAIPALWAFVFASWAFVGASLFDKTIPDSPNQLYKASLFIAAMLAIYGVTKKALAMGRMGIPGGMPGGGLAKIGMGVAAAYAGRSVATGIMAKNTATQTVSHALPDGSTVSQSSKLMGRSAKDAMAAGQRHSADPSSQTALKKRSMEASVNAKEASMRDARTAETAAANPGTMQVGASTVQAGGNTMRYDRQGQLMGPAGETQSRHKAAWDRQIGSASSSGNSPSESQVRQAGAAFSSADRASFGKLASEAQGEGRTEGQAQAHFSDQMSRVLAGSDVSTQSGKAPDGLTIATASPTTVSTAFAPGPAGPPTGGSGGGGSSSTGSAGGPTSSPAPAQAPSAVSGQKAPTYDSIWASDSDLGRSATASAADQDARTKQEDIARNIAENTGRFDEPRGS